MMVCWEALSFDAEFENGNREEDGMSKSSSDKQFVHKGALKAVVVEAMLFEQRESLPGVREAWQTLGPQSTSYEGPSSAFHQLF